MAKKGEVSVYEVQKANKPPIEDVCNTLLNIPELKEGMARLLALSRKLRMKPCWSHTNVWNCNYKGKRVVSYGIGRGGGFQENHLVIRVYPDNNNLVGFLLTLSEEMRAEFIDGIKCTGCGGCKPGTKIDISGKPCFVCWRTEYCRINPSAEQFEWIVKFIFARRAYIKNTINSNGKGV